MSLTNATKAQIIVAINAIFGLLTAFDIGISDTQKGAIIVAANAILGFFVGATYKNSPKRIPEGTAPTVQPT
jgi:hypothetical protein